MRRPIASTGVIQRHINVGDAIIVLIIAFPLMGAFFPPETYFAAQDFGLEAAATVSHSSYFTTATLVFYLLLGYLAFATLLDPHAMIRGILRNKTILLFVGYVLLTSSWSDLPGPSLNRGGRLLIISLYAVYLVEHYELPHLTRLLTRAGAIATAGSILAMILVPQFAYSHLSGYQDAWRGALPHKNALGALAGLCVLISLYSLRIRANRPDLTWFVLLGSLLLMVMARSATAGAAVIAAVVLAAGLQPINESRTTADKILLCCVAVLTLAGGMALLYLLGDPLELFGRDATLTGRVQVWDVAWNVISMKPIWGYGHGFWGSGSAMVVDAWNRLGWATPHAHSTWIDLWLQLGLVGLALGILIWASALWSAGTLLLTSRVEGCVFWCAVLTTLAVRSMSETLFVDPGVEDMFWLVLASASLARMSAERVARLRARQNGMLAHAIKD